MGWEGERVHTQAYFLVSSKAVAAKRRVRDAFISQGKIKVHEAENLGTHANVAAWVNLDWHSMPVTAVLSL